MDKYRDIKEKMLDLARKDEDIKAIVSKVVNIKEERELI